MFILINRIFIILIFHLLLKLIINLYMRAIYACVSLRNFNSQASGSDTTLGDFFPEQRPESERGFLRRLSHKSKESSHNLEVKSTP